VKSSMRVVILFVLGVNGSDAKRSRNTWE